MSIALAARLRLIEARVAELERRQTTAGSTPDEPKRVEKAARRKPLKHRTSK